MQTKINTANVIPSPDYSDLSPVLADSCRLADLEHASRELDGIIGALPAFTRILPHLVQLSEQLDDDINAIRAKLESARY